MAVSKVLLSIGAADLPSGAANNLAPALQRVISSGADPKVSFLQLAFDAAADEMCSWSFDMPDDYASGPILRVRYKMVSATTGAVRLEGRVSAITPADAVDADAQAFDTTNSNGGTVPGTAGHVASIDITLTNADSLAAGDWVIVYLRRDADGTTGTDDAAGDMELVSASLVYTTT